MLLYIYYYGGGDSVAFWSGSNNFVELLLKDPGNFFKVFWANSSDDGINVYFSANGITIPGWIFREQEGYFVSKIGFFFSLLSGGNYLLTSLWFMLLSFVAQWQFFAFIQKNYIVNASKIYWLLLYIPSVSFWCSGISKDTLVLISVLGITRIAIQFFFLKDWRFGKIVWLLFYSYLLIRTREVIFSIVLVAFVTTFLLTLVNNIRQTALRFFARFLMITIGFGSIVAITTYSSMSNKVDTYLSEAEVIQQDFANNELYGGKAYSIGVSEYTLSGMILTAPISIATGVFRPFLWESFSVSLILNGIESILLMYLFFRRNILHYRSFGRSLLGNKLVFFSLVIVLLYAFSTGFTSIIFGVLVRLRAPLLIFFGILIYWRDFSLPSQEKSSSEAEFHS